VASDLVLCESMSGYPACRYLELLRNDGERRETAGGGSLPTNNQRAAAGRGAEEIGKLFLSPPHFFCNYSGFFLQ